MLVRLWKLPDGAPLRAELLEKGIRIRRCNPYERHIVVDFVQRTFSPKWVSECKIAMGHTPIGCYVATQDHRVIGFVCCDVTARGYVGPLGVDPSVRKMGIGKALLITALEQLGHLGYVYAIIGGVAPGNPYDRWVGATPIDDSAPGVYEDILPDPQM